MSSPKSMSNGSFSSSRRARMSVFACIGLLSLISMFFLFSWTNERFNRRSRMVPEAPLLVANGTCDLDPPANWTKLYRWEDNLAQHNLDLPAPEGKHGRYVYFANQIQQLGWNNQLNEVLMNAFLAYKSNRAYVFQDYIWKPEYYPWSSHPHKLPLPRTPANALFSGPAAGGPWGRNDPAPRAISQRFFDKACPQDERRIINTREVKPALVNATGSVVFQTWQTLLSEAPERCIEIQAASLEEDTFGQTFDLWLFGTTRILSLWEPFRDSPVSRLFSTSPIVQSAVERNAYLFAPRGPRVLDTPTSPWDRTLAIHVRRGDYEGACHDLARYNSTFYSWNLLPELPDPFTHPPGWDVDQALTLQTYLARCYPSIDGILSKIRSSRDEYVRAARPGEVRVVDTIFILTNAHAAFLDELRGRLYKEGGWYNVVTTRDLELDAQQKDVGMAVDMEFARKAAVFVGNGWSSFTSNIVHRRLVDGREPLSIRFA